MTNNLVEAHREDPTEIRQATEKGVNSGYSHADATWKEMALECVRVIALEKSTFTMNDVRWLVRQSPIKTHDNRAMGGVIKKAQKLGWVQPTGQSIPSKVGHGVSLQIWKSNLYKHPTLFP